MIPKRPEPSEYPERYARYLDLVPETDLPKALLHQLDETSAFLAAIPASRQDHRYAPEKWTVREVVGHILDTERILGFRLLVFARGDDPPMRRADEDLYVRNAEFSRLPMAELVEEFALLRRANVKLLEHLPDAAWNRTGVMNDTPVSVRALAYLLAGHERHHLSILRTRYLQGQ